MEGKIETLDVDEVIVAIGVSPNPIIPSTVKGLDISRKGTIVTDDNLRAQYTDPKEMKVLYAGGDIVRGGATVILAMSDGRKAAKAMHEELTKA